MRQMNLITINLHRWLYRKRFRKWHHRTKFGVSSEAPNFQVAHCRKSLQNFFSPTWHRDLQTPRCKRVTDRDVASAKLYGEKTTAKNGGCRHKKC